jgi:hypothetical protein
MASFKAPPRVPSLLSLMRPRHITAKAGFFCAALGHFGLCSWNSPNLVTEFSEWGQV